MGLRVAGSTDAKPAAGRSKADQVAGVLKITFELKFRLLSFRQVTAQ